MTIDLSPRVRADLDLTAAVADFAVDTRFDDLPAEVVAATERIILDTVACSIGAVDTAPGRAVMAFKRAQGGTPQATVVGAGDVLSASSATYVNAQLANVLDADETLLNFSHFASTIVAPALAVGEMTGASGADVVTAVAVGFEVGGRYGLALPNNDLAEDGTVVFALNRGFSWAAFGSAAAAGRLLGLDADELAHAFGIVMATTPVHGVLERFGSAMTHWHKYAMYGAVAEAGVNAALLAKEGFLADDKALDRAGTSYRAFGASTWDPDLLVEDLGSRWLIAETSIKRYPFCRYAAGAIDMFDRIVRDEDLGADDIEEVVVTVPPFKFLQFIADMPLPSQPFEIMVSLRYAYSLIAAGVPAGPAWWDQATIDDPAHQVFAAKVRSAVNPEWRSVMVDQIATEGYFREIPISLEVRTTDGTTTTATSSYAKGDPWGPGSEMTDDELRTKVRDFTGPALGADRAQQLIDAGFGLAGAADLRAFVDAMAQVAR